MTRVVIAREKKTAQLFEQLNAANRLFVVDCDESRHVLGLTFKGQLVAFDHDVRSEWSREEVLLAMGGQVSGCFQVYCKWREDVSSALTKRVSSRFGVFLQDARDRHRHRGYGRVCSLPENWPWLSRPDAVLRMVRRFAMRVARMQLETLDGTIYVSLGDAESFLPIDTTGKTELSIFGSSQKYSVAGRPSLEYRLIVLEPLFRKMQSITHGLFTRLPRTVDSRRHNLRYSAAALSAIPLLFEPGFMVIEAVSGNCLRYLVHTRGSKDGSSSREDGI